MNYTDQQLQVALAKMLPEKLVIQSALNTPAYVCWKIERGFTPKVKETEWLHVCWLIEQTLTPEQYFGRNKDSDGYIDYLFQLCRNKRYSASWQHRAIALAKVKGVEIL